MTSPLPDFTIEFQSEGQRIGQTLRDEAERRLRNLAKGHQDITGAAVAISLPAKTESGFIYKARVVAYVRPENLAGTEKADTIEGALKGALDAVERQVRKKREKLGEPWKRPDIPGNPGA